jgi:hypothetical protein
MASSWAFRLVEPRLRLCKALLDPSKLGFRLLDRRPLRVELRLYLIEAACSSLCQSF